MSILAGYKSLTGHMFRVGIPKDDTCSSSYEEGEFTEYFLCEFTSYGRIRYQIFGVDMRQLQRIASHLLMEKIGVNTMQSRHERRFYRASG